MNAAIPSANTFTYCGGWATAYIVTHDVVLSTFTAGPSPITHVLRQTIFSSTECSNGGKMARAVLRARLTSSAALNWACFWAVDGDGLPDVATTVESDG
ncbi:similar to An11g04970 [Aspergillus luchuensis]|uniref:Similar to An11g04970 n=1 Tax=Aspergillus kawachii TaxID=1069201 RepID=A0A146F142_ASPKA|nr:similar to An11g04970 [Aspergillus luchuensis]